MKNPTPISENAETEGAAVLQLRRGNRKNLLKFCSFMVLMAITVGGVLTLCFGISSLVRSYFGVN